MKTLQLMRFAVILAMGGSLAVQAAGYMKFDGIDGEAKNAPEEKPATGQKRVQQPPNQSRGLLLPAVQKAREAPARSQEPPHGKARRGNVEAEWKVEKGE